ncbi:cell division protein FtsZ [Shewanella denitrificans OS217]|jgi:cell division protein FtsZ|uniref:Cell division protein FtsZ n=2 Tax=Shewanella TaxID=22 RepID=Q12NJ4_SHEDO|nr:cell division protein FtsZ [Shewanella denitrificans OS217]
MALPSPRVDEKGKSNMGDFANRFTDTAVIKVLGVGGCGGNAVDHMLTSQLEGIEFIAINTDAQALANVKTESRLQLGGQLTRGLGAGANPDVGRQAALEDKQRLMDILTGTDLVFIMAGMGGGTGTGASPIIAALAREMGILTVAVVTKPFPFEGKKRLSIADKGVQALGQQVDSLIVIPNDKLLAVLGKNTRLLDAFNAANDVLLSAVKGIADLITCPGIINVDFADVRAVMANRGAAIMGSARAKGDNRAYEATERAIRSPLMQDSDLQGAKSILVNITAGLDFSLGEFIAVGEAVEQFAADSAMIVVGTVIDPALSDEISVTLVATGVNQQPPFFAPASKLQSTSPAPQGPGLMQNHPLQSHFVQSQPLQSQLAQFERVPQQPVYSQKAADPAQLVSAPGAQESAAPAPAALAHQTSDVAATTRPSGPSYLDPCDFEVPTFLRRNTELLED